MAITTRDGLVSAMAARGRTQWYKQGPSAQTAGRHLTLFRAAGQPGASTLATPGTTGAALSSASSGALAMPGAVGGQTCYCTSWAASTVQTVSLALADRLVEFGGLSGIVTIAQNLSALALPARATSATDVELWLEVYTALGATPSATVTASYTNQAGTAGRTATLAGGIPASMAATQMRQFALQAGDTGVQSVQSVTSTTSTGTAGNFGVTLRRTLVVGIPQGSTNTANGFMLGWGETDLEIIPDAACLEIYAMPSGVAVGDVYGDVGIAQG